MSNACLAAADNENQRLQAELVRLWLHSQSPLITTAVFNLVIAWALRNSLSRTLLLAWSGTAVGWSKSRHSPCGGSIGASRATMTKRCIGDGCSLPCSPEPACRPPIWRASRFYTEHQMFIVMWVAGLTAGATATYGADSNKVEASERRGPRC